MRKILATLLFTLTTTLTLAAPSGAAITIRTGQVGGVPGNPTAGGTDDCFRWIQDQCGLPLAGAPFASEFPAAASSVNSAQVVVPMPAWLPALAADPSARWINFDRGAGGFGTAGSALYACEFLAEPDCAFVDIECWWAVDDQLGDDVGVDPNPIGVYLNGTPLPAAFSGGNFSTESFASASNVPVSPGVNYFYVYQRDTQCAASGLLLSARITCACNGSDPGSIQGNKFWDENCNGARDEWEVGLAGFDIELRGPVDAVARTDANGNYSFVGLPPGNYTVSEITQPGWILSYPIGGSYQVFVCGDDHFGRDFGNCECIGDNLLPPPPCTVAWLPLDEGSGSVSLEVVGGNSASLSGSPLWVSGQVGGGLDFPFAGNYAELGSSSTPSFGSDAFAISAWIRSPNSDGLQRTIIDKRTSSGGLQGVSLYLVNNRLGLQIASGGTAVDYVSSGTVLTDDTWHHITAVVCRSEDTATNSIDFYVDGAVDAQWSGASVQQGDVDNTAKLRIGQPSASFPPGPPLDAKLDEVMFFDCCLAPVEVEQLRIGVSTAMAYLPSAILPCGATANVKMQICNYSAFPRTYTWTLAGRPGCDVPGPTTFTPSSGTVSLPHGPSCAPISSVVEVPSWLTGTDTACFELIVYEHETGRCFTLTNGVLRASSWLWVDPGDDVSVAVDQAFTYDFELQNGSSDYQNLDLLIVPTSFGNGGPSPHLGLDGLPPGEPVVRTVKIPPGEGGIIEGSGRLTGFAPTDWQEIWLMADPFGTGELIRVASIPVRSILDEATSDAPDMEPGGPIDTEFLLRAAPNPFRDKTEIHLEIDQHESISVQVIDVTGRLIRDLYSGVLPPGAQRFSWDGVSRSGRSVAPGIYWVRVTGRTGTRESRVVRLK